ncbi:uncharacterized protein [Primulina eburnea]|uniref:uncharacterized protein n=1 Tax=Primulina eburnea TaxID=1245227 RepID=UPI003C6C95F2
MYPVFLPVILCAWKETPESWNSLYSSVSKEGNRIMAVPAAFLMQMSKKWAPFVIPLILCLLHILLQVMKLKIVAVGENELNEESWMRRRDDIVTRLRSGVLSPVKYNASGSCGVFQGRPSSGKKTKMETGKGHNAFERMLRKRSFPLRPCNSYAFFVMTNWGGVKCSSFEETSKRLSKKWCELPNDMKKEYENLASKDSARYMRQCLLLKNDVQEETGSELLEDEK